MKGVQVLKNGEMIEIDLFPNNEKMKHTIIDQLLEKSKSQGNGLVKDLYVWPYEGKELICYGWYDGEPGFENKHDLPSGGKSRFLDTDSATQLLYGDIFMISRTKDKIHSLDIAGYGEFYSMMFGGFEDCGSEDDIVETSDEEVEEAEDIKDESDDDTIEYSCEDDSDLEYDESEY